MIIDENNKQKNYNALQNIFMENREKLSISGIEDVLSFDDQVVIVITDLGLLTIKGENLHITKLNLDTSEIIVEGELDSLAYSEKNIENKNHNMFNKIFK